MTTDERIAALEGRIAALEGMPEPTRVRTQRARELAHRELCERDYAMRQGERDRLAAERLARAASLAGEWVRVELAAGVGRAVAAGHDQRGRVVTRGWDRSPRAQDFTASPQILRGAEISSNAQLHELIMAGHLAASPPSAAEVALAIENEEIGL